MVDKPQIDKIVDAFGQEGLRFLFIFKILKEEVQLELRNEKKVCPTEEILNQQCAKFTRELLLNGDKTPTDEEIRKKVIALKSTLTARS